MENASIAKIHCRMKSGELTCEQLVSYYLQRIEAYDKNGPCINSIISINPKALEQARELDRQFQTVGFTGPLHGIPVLVKDNIDTVDMLTTAGSVCLLENKPAQDAFIVKKLKDAGALILAKANLHEFAIWGETVSSAGGQTLNPYDLHRTPGGSSGGTGAGIAADLATVGIGTDTVNSIRSPASANCLVGLRPTLGLVSRSGIIPYSLTQDTAGPITRTVEDAALVLNIISGFEASDEKTAWCDREKQLSYLPRVDAGLTGKRIGVLQKFFGKDAEHEEVNGIVLSRIDLMRSLGAEIIDLHDQVDSDYLTTQVSVHLYDCNEDLNAYLQAQDRQLPVRSLQEIVESGRYHPSLDANFRKALTLSKSSQEYKDHIMRRSVVRDQVMQIMASNSLDAVVYPHQKRLVVPIGQTQIERNGVLAAVTGFPSVAIPAGFSAPSIQAPIGVPVGLELLGRPWSEALLLEIAYVIEQNASVRKNPLSAPSLHN